MNSQLLIGLSLSFCVRDMLAGRVNPASVYCILTGCLPTGDGNTIDPTDVPNEYYESYWKDYSREQIDAVLQSVVLVARVRGGLNIANGHWIRTEEQYGPLIQGNLVE